MADERLGIKVLADRTRVSPRTIHFYIHQGLLRPTGAPGPGAKYTRSHLDRLTLIKRLQRQHLPLSEIRERLAGLSDEQVSLLLAEAPASRVPARPSSATDYIRQVLLGQGAARPESDARDAGGRTRAKPPLSPEDRLRMAAGQIRAPLGWDRSQWERVVLTRNVELHVRRPLSREQNRQVERLLAAARDILEES